jgi:signal peptidase II
MTSSGRALGWSALIALAVVVVDQLTKQWALSALDDRNIDLFWTLRLNLVLNSGMAFGQADGWGPVIGVVAIGVIVVLLVSLRSGSGWLGTIGVGLVVGGAVGNLLDRLFRGDGWLRGPVVDFVDFQWFPVFNVADIAINVGAGLLILGAVLSDRRRRALEPAE